MSEKFPPYAAVIVLEMNNFGLLLISTFFRGVLYFEKVHISLLGTMFSGVVIFGSL